MGNSPHPKRIFVDTSAFIALQDRGDQFHSVAVKFNHYLGKNKFDIYTSNYVLDETFTLLKIRAGHAVAKKFGQDIFRPLAFKSYRNYDIAFASRDLLAGSSTTNCFLSECNNGIVRGASLDQTDNLKVYQSFL